MGRRSQNEIPSNQATNVDKYLSRLTDKYRPRFTRLFANKGTQNDAIKAKCYDCVGFEDVTNAVNECRAFTCPLWIFRPVTQADNDE